MVLSGMPSFRFHGLTVPHCDNDAAYSSTTSSPASPLVTPIPASPSSDSTSPAAFTHPTEPMPLPGPAHYEARRALWLKPQPHPPRPPSPSTSRARLETLLSQEGAIESDDVWNAGLRSVWKGLVGGVRLRRRLPLAMVLKILHAGWVRDGTWPSDDVSASPAPPPPLPIHVPGSGGF